MATLPSTEGEVKEIDSFGEIPIMPRLTGNTESSPSSENITELKNEMVLSDNSSRGSRIISAGGHRNSIHNLSWKNEADSISVLENMSIPTERHENRDSLSALEGVSNSIKDAPNDTLHSLAFSSDDPDCLSELELLETKGYDEEPSVIVKEHRCSPIVENTEDSSTELREKTKAQSSPSTTSPKIYHSDIPNSPTVLEENKRWTDEKKLTQKKTRLKKMRSQTTTRLLLPRTAHLRKELAHFGGNQPIVKLRRRSTSVSESVSYQGTIDMASNKWSRTFEFKDIKILGSGQFGDVYLVKDKLSNELFAQKRILKNHLDLNMRRQFLRELRVYLNCDHNNIIQVVGFGEKRDYYLITMEWARGGSAVDYFKSRVPLDPYEVKIIIAQLLSALRCLHLTGICHRDLKLGNLLVVDAANVKLADFGLALIYEEDELKKNVRERRQSTAQVGTTFFKAPEVLSGEGHSFPVDLWSVGIITWQLIAGGFPFMLRSSRQIKGIQRQIDKLRMPKGTSNDFENFIKGLLDINPHTRFTVDQAALHPWLRGVQTPTEADLKPMSPRAGRKFGSYRHMDLSTRRSSSPGYRVKTSVLDNLIDDGNQPEVLLES